MEKIKYKTQMTTTSSMVNEDQKNLNQNINMLYQPNFERPKKIKMIELKESTTVNTKHTQNKNRIVTQTFSRNSSGAQIINDFDSESEIIPSSI